MYLILDACPKDLLKIVNLEALFMLTFFTKNPALSIIGIVFGTLVLWPVLHNLSSENDFDLFMMAAQKWKLQEPVYKNAIIHGRFYYYSPLFVTLLQPFLWLSDFQTETTSIFAGYAWSIITAKAFWSVFNLYILYYFIGELNQRLQFESRQTRNWFWGLALFLCYRWVFLNLWHSQLTLFLLWAMYHSALPKHKNIYSQWWSIIAGINIKIVPGLWLLKMGFEKKLEEIAWICAGFILLLFIPIFFFPSGYVIEETMEWVQRINPLKSQHVITLGEGGFIDVASLVVKYFTRVTLENEPTVALADWGLTPIFWVSQIMRVLILGGILFLWKLILKSKVYEPSLLIFALFSMGIPLIFPHQRDYSLAFLIPAVLYLVYAYVTQLYWMNTVLSALTFVSLVLMGNVLFFEIFSYEMRVWLIGVRLQGLGALMFYLCFGAFVFDYCRDTRLTDKPENDQSYLR